MSDTEALFLDLHLSISDGFLKIKIFDKRDDFDFYNLFDLLECPVMLMTLMFVTRF